MISFRDFFKKRHGDWVDKWPVGSKYNDTFLAVCDAVADYAELATSSKKEPLAPSIEQSYEDLRHRLIRIANMHPNTPGDLAYIAANIKPYFANADLLSLAILTERMRVLLKSLGLWSEQPQK